VVGRLAALITAAGVLLFLLLLWGVVPLAERMSGTRHVEDRGDS